MRYLTSLDIRVDTLECQVYRRGQKLKLPELSYHALLALMQAHPAHLTNDQLGRAVWGQQAVSPETVTQRIALLRKALNPDGLEPQDHIASLRNKGYRWIPATRQSNHPDNKFWYQITAVILVALCWLLWLLLANQHNTTNHDSKATDMAASAQVSAADLSEQAWHYLQQHTANSTAIAVDLFRQSLSASSGQTHAWVGLSMALSHQVTKFNQAHDLLIEARSAALQATELSPENALAWSALAFVDDAAGRIDQAISGYEKALDLDPNNQSTLSSLAYLYSQQGRLVEALKLSVAALHSKQLYLDLQIAHTLELLDRDVLAEQWYAKADTLSPDNVFVTPSRARFYLANGQPKMAESIINEAQTRGIQRPELPIILGIMHWSNDRLVEATNAFVEAIEVDPQDGQAHMLLLALKQQSNPPESIHTLLEPWFDPKTRWPEHWVYCAQVFAAAGDQVQAMVYLEKAVELGYRNADWLNYLPAFNALRQDSAWPLLIEAITIDIEHQNSQLNEVDWLPEGFMSQVSRQ